MHRASAAGPSCKGGSVFAASAGAAVSGEQLRQGFARSNRYFDSTTAEVCATIKKRTGARANLGSPPLIVNASKGKRLQPAANAGAALLGRALSFSRCRFAPVIHRQP